MLEHTGALFACLIAVKDEEDGGSSEHCLKMMAAAISCWWKAVKRFG